MASIIKEIVLKAYPDIKKYNNVPIYVKQYDCAYSNEHEYNELNRLITFEIKE